MHYAKQAAKEAACQLAIEQGLLDALQLLVPPRKKAPYLFQGVLPRVDRTLTPEEIQELADPISWLTSCMNKYLKADQKLEYLDLFGSSTHNTAACL
jgi:hypothetical protein